MKVIKKALPAVVAVAALAASTLTPSTRAQAPDNNPIKPEIPSVDRHNPDRVFLEHADELRATSMTDYQVLVGNVEFRRDGMFMYCDSAHFYDKTGSFDAFGNVRMEQGDTLFVYSDTLNYSDPERKAVLIAAYGKKVRLINRDVELTTDVFNYDLAADVGYYEIGGVLTDKQNRLTSLEGEYSPTTKEALFHYNVHLTSLNNNDTLQIFTDNLLYNTATHVAEMTTDSRVVNSDGVIYTTNGVYNTETTQAELYDRSTVESKNGNTITGDTLYYDRKAGRGEAFGNMEINDTANHVILQGDYGYYDELIDSAFVTGRARAIEYSTADSLFLHGDTIRAFRRCGFKEKQIKIATPDSIIARMKAERDALIEANASAALENSNAGAENSESYENEPDVDNAGQSVDAQADSITATAPTNEAYNFPDSIMSTVEVPDTVRFIVANPKVKFYRRDIQGLCDSMTFVSTDTMLYMDRRPIVWSDNRQISGAAITMHLNDSTVDWAFIPEQGFMAEMIEEGYYNQLSGKEMKARFKAGALDRLDVSGNVLAITFPEESDSTINKVMNIESSFLAAKFKDNNIDSMKLWAETNAKVTPLYLAKKSIFFLPDFKWLGEFRPTSADDVFDFTPELIDFINSAKAYVAPVKASARSQQSRSLSTAPTEQPAIKPEEETPTENADAGATNNDGSDDENGENGGGATGETDGETPREENEIPENQDSDEDTNTPADQP